MSADLAPPICIASPRSESSTHHPRQETCVSPRRVLSDLPKTSISKDTIQAKETSPPSPKCVDQNPVTPHTPMTPETPECDISCRDGVDTDTGAVMAPISVSLSSITASYLPSLAYSDSHTVCAPSIEVTSTPTTTTTTTNAAVSKKPHTPHPTIDQFMSGRTRKKTLQQRQLPSRPQNVRIYFIFAGTIYTYDVSICLERRLRDILPKLSHLLSSNEHILGYLQTELSSHQHEDAGSSWMLSSHANGIIKEPIFMYKQQTRFASQTLTEIGFKQAWQEHSSTTLPTPTPVQDACNGDIKKCVVSSGPYLIVINCAEYGEREAASNSLSDAEHVHSRSSSKRQKRQNGNATRTSRSHYMHLKRAAESLGYSLPLGVTKQQLVMYINHAVTVVGQGGQIPRREMHMRTPTRDFQHCFEQEMDPLDFGHTRAVVGVGVPDDQKHRSQSCVGVADSGRSRRIRTRSNTRRTTTTTGIGTGTSRNTRVRRRTEVSSLALISGGMNSRMHNPHAHVHVHNRHLPRLNLSASTSASNLSKVELLSPSHAPASASVVAGHSRSALSKLFRRSTSTPVYAVTAAAAEETATSNGNCIQSSPVSPLSPMEDENDLFGCVIPELSLDGDDGFADDAGTGDENHERSQARADRREKTAAHRASSLTRFGRQMRRRLSSAFAAQNAGRPRKAKKNKQEKPILSYTIHTQQQQVPLELEPQKHEKEELQQEKEQVQLEEQHRIQIVRNCKEEDQKKKKKKRRMRQPPAAAAVRPRPSIDIIRSNSAKVTESTPQRMPVGNSRAAKRHTVTLRRAQTISPDMLFSPSSSSSSSASASSSCSSPSCSPPTSPSSLTMSMNELPALCLSQSAVAITRRSSHAEVDTEELRHPVRIERKKTAAIIAEGYLSTNIAQAHPPHQHSRQAQKWEARYYTFNEDRLLCCFTKKHTGTPSSSTTDIERIALAHDACSFSIYTNGAEQHLIVTVAFSVGKTVVKHLKGTPASLEKWKRAFLF